ncbi:MAG TPA: tetratricopeptide repeat protein [Bryobacteraceae bacterium]|jgi:tetratricopeptide (TPR) repeat protein|nr:tetratricopeptide repeat protein [Bryobacteraceae bacterium]
MMRCAVRTIIAAAGLVAAALAQTPNKPAAGGSSFERLAKQADAARTANQVDDAIRLYKQALRIKPSWEEGWFSLGMLNYQLDQYEEGRDAFRHLTVINPNVAVGWAMLGLCEFETKQYAEALRHLEKGNTLGLGQSEQIADVTTYHLAMLLTRYERYEEAMKLLTQFSQHGKDTPDYVQAMGIAALRKPLLPSEVPPTEHELVMDVGRAMFDATALRMSEAASEFRRLIEKYPKESNIHYLFGTFLLYSDANQALDQFKQELEITPNHVPTLVTMAGEYAQREDYKTGLVYAERAVEASRDSFAAHAVLGRILMAGDINLEQGIKELETARRLEPGSPQVHFFLATAYGKAGRKEDAAREREEFMKLRKEFDESTAAAERRSGPKSDQP